VRLETPTAALKRARDTPALRRQWNMLETMVSSFMAGSVQKLHTGCKAPFSR
jgi:hypothetical protein